MNLKITIPPAVRHILDTLKGAGYEAYIVGGCVRDALLGREPQDWDITTSALPAQVKELFSHTVDTGIQHGTVMVLSHGGGYEITTYRVDGEYKDSRHPEQVTFTRSLAEDLKRRDFTINAFAWDEEGLVDLFDGLSDLEHGIIRCVGDPSQRFAEDALRIMRAVRFSAQLGFTIEEATRQQITHFAGKLANISMERIRVEWEKTILSPHPSYVNLYARLGLAPFIIHKVYGKCFDKAAETELEEIIRRRNERDKKSPMEAWPQNFFDKNFYAQMYRWLAFACFFRNLAPEEADGALRQLKYDNKTRNHVVSILRHAGLPILPDRIQIKKQLNAIGLETMAAILEWRHICLCCPPDARRYLEEVYSEIGSILVSGEPWSLSQLAVNGSDLIAAGVPAGKKIGEILENILQKVIQSPTLNTKEKLCDPAFLEEVEHECKG